MKKLTLIIIFSIAFSFSAFSQNETDSIEIKRKSGAYLFTLHGDVLTFREMMVLMNNNPQSYNYLQKANSAVALGRFVSFAGGFTIGYSLSPILRGEKINLKLTFLGSLVSIISIPIRLSAYKNIHKAVVIFNNGIFKPEKVTYDINIGFTDNGLALAIRF